MIPRVCIQRDIRSSRATPCSLTDLVKAMRDPHVQEICDNIKTLQNGEQYDKELVQAYKQQLPAITPHACQFKSNQRKSENATASGLVMLDVDGVEDVSGFRSQISSPEYQKLLKTNQIYFVAITPSGHGLRVIGERKQGETLEKGMARLASVMGVVEYDQCTKDLARLSYLMPWSYVLYFDGDGFCWSSEEDLPGNSEQLIANSSHADGGWASAGYWLRKEYELDLNMALEHLTSPEAAAENALLRESVDKTREYPTEYDGLPYKAIIDELISIHGGDPKIGERNSMFFTLAIDLRYICDFDAEHLLRIMPDFGLSVQERKNSIRSALSRPRRNIIPDLVQRALTAVKQEQESEQGLPIDKSLLNADNLRLPRLPRLLQVLCRNLPEAFRPAMCIAALPVLGALATSVRFKYLDGQIHSFSFMSCIAAPAATGKSFIRTPIDLLLTPINEQDEIERQKQDDYREALKKSKNSKQQPEDPHACPRNNGISISVAALLKLLYYSGGKHLIAIGEEIDTLAKSERAGVWSQKTDIYRLAFDNAVYGQQYISENSFSAKVNVYYNFLITGTTGGMYRFFNDVENGLVTRVAFATLPDMFATPIPRFEDYSQAEKDYIISVARRLYEEEGMIECPKVNEALAAWQEEKRKLAELTDSRAVDIIRRRSGVIGFRAGMMAYLLSDKRSAKQASEFGLWVAEYVFRQQMTLFGEKFEQSSAAQQKAIEQSRGQVRNLLEQLPQKFTTADLIGLRRKNGQSTQVGYVLTRWSKSGLIRKIGDKCYSKVG